MFNKHLSSYFLEKDVVRRSKQKSLKIKALKKRSPRPTFFRHHSSKWMLPGSVIGLMVGLFFGPLFAFFGLIAGAIITLVTGTILFALDYCDEKGIKTNKAVFIFIVFAPLFSSWLINRKFLKKKYRSFTDTILESYDFSRHISIYIVIIGIFMILVSGLLGYFLAALTYCPEC